MDKNIISVIIPVYNQEKYLRKCLDSILCQTYRELEIILVDDASTDTSSLIMKEYAVRDRRIKITSHRENKGLFQARITGVEASSGKYIAFVDSDDYVSVDWFRKLVRKAEQTGSDIVVGEWCFDASGAHCDYCNLDHFRIKDYSLVGEQVQQEFMSVCGRNFSWTVVWNKLYTRELWDSVSPLLKEFSQSHGHMLMWEDIAFSFAFFTKAAKLTNVHDIYYYYYKSVESATTLSNNEKRNLKYIRDASAAMKFGKRVLEEAGLYAKYETEYVHWKKYGMSILYKELVTNLGKTDYEEKILTAFECSREDVLNEDSFFLSVTTPVGDEFNKLEAIKKSIVSQKTKYVSFDIFDTLIARPFYYPTDLFEYLSEKLNANLSAYVNFRVIREAAERAVRQKLDIAESSREDVTLDEIYEYIKGNYCFSAEIVDDLKAYEAEIELGFCTQRQIGRELYELAIESGKSIIILSDMYLPYDVISAMLKKNGYSGFEKLYISGEVGFTKARKSLFRFVQKELNEDANAFVHIGDNYQSDIVNASSCGWNTGYLPKAIDLIRNSDPTHYTGDAFNRVYRSSHSKEDYECGFNQYTSVRSMVALIANKFFDNPHVSVRPDSDYNVDPRAVGYAALGPHLLALCNWIYRIAKREKIGTIHFVARDGYLVKQAFDACGFPNVKSNYIRLSRKALLLADVDQKEDLYSLFNKVQHITTPKRIAEYLKPIIPKNLQDSLEALFERNDMPFNKKFTEYTQFFACMKIYIDQVVDMTMLHEYKAKLKDYFLGIFTPGDYLFDIGYSGRPEAALSNLLGYPIGSLYIHKNTEIADIRFCKYNCPSEVFYQFKPIITGVIREHILMELGPSTLGYTNENGSIVPMLEEYKSDYRSDCITKVLQENAILFIEDYCNFFGSSSLMFSFPHDVMSAFWEDYLHCSKPIDRMMFTSLTFEDDIGELPNIKALDFWNSYLKRIQVTDTSINNPDLLSSIIQSRSWRITAPMRKLTARLRENRYTYLILKGVKSLLKDGIVITWRKIKKKV